MVEEMTVDELHARLRDGDDLQVVDIRPEQRYRAGHIPGAINVPFSTFTRAVDEVDWADEIVVVCPKGQSSLQAARLLESFEGVDDETRVANLTGGYREWAFDLERES